MSKTLLVIDDDLDVLDAMHLVLRTAGYDVHCASDGREALAMLRAGLVPALVITDLMMPDLTGWDVVAFVGDNPGLRHVPVVLTTASFVTSWPTGIDVLEKPFELDELLTVVRKHCAFSSDVASVGELRLDSMSSAPAGMA